VIRPLHDRMPVILEKDQCSAWLSPQSTPSLLEELLHPAREDVLTAYPVSSKVNRPGIDTADCLEPLQAPGRLVGR
jgi:putative SOS response-associated peptidase YedK